MTLAFGLSPPNLHLISLNFSAPKSAPNPASVTTYSHSPSPVFVARSELQPWAIFAKGPPWIIAGVCSVVWTRFGFNASFITTATDPVALISSTVTGLLS